MESFLCNVARKLWERHHDELDRILVVFNNRRAGLFLQNHLQSLDSGPFFLPRIIGIDDLVNELGNCHIAPHEFLLFELFDIHRKMEGQEHRFESFEEFMSFGEMMVKDFSELDLYLVDAKQLFENLHELKRLGEWDLSGQPRTSLQEKYLLFYKSLFQYYTELRERLQKQGRAYSGMAYRYVAENIGQLTGKLDYKHIYFVGFNALSNSEATIIDCLARQGLADTVFDGDAFYFNDKQKEAGLFLRRHAQRFPNVGDFENHFAQGRRHIHIVNCPENSIQTKVAGQIVSSLSPEKTAVVLADESLLLPMLNSLPPNVVSTNVTMGFPYSLTGCHNLVSKLFSLYIRSRDDGFYHADVTALLADHMLARCIGNANLKKTVKDTVNSKKSIRLTTGEMQSMLENIVNGGRLLFLFEKECPSVDEVLSILKKTVELLENSGILDSNNKEKEALACLMQILNYLKELQHDYSFIGKTQTLQRIYEHLANRRSVSFYGKPLSGMQLLGMLETRNLDFPNIILTSANEGILPAGRNDYSLIPLTLKRAFGMPTFEEKDAVYAYHFFRMIQRADNVWLLYSSNDEGMGKGEPSRFLSQVKNELAPQFPNIEVDEVSVSAFSSPLQFSPILSVKKDARVFKLLQSLALNGFSPSMLNRYRNCPLQFYYMDLLGARQPDEMSEEIMAKELGTFIHSFLCKIYEPFKGTTMPVEALQKALANLDNDIAALLRDNLLKGRNGEGKNYIYSNIAKIQISAFLKDEIDSLKNGHQLEIVMTEDEMKTTLGDVDRANCLVYIKGFADRVDLVDGILRIADYKSGKVEPAELKVDTSNPDTHEVPDKWFQVMAYAWLYFRKYPSYYGRQFLAGIFPLKALSAGFLATSWESSQLLQPEHIDRFGMLLKELINELFNPDIDFLPTSNKKNCKYCPFAQTCPQPTE